MTPTLDMLILKIISCPFWQSQWYRASLTFHNETQSGHTSLEANYFSFFSEHHVFFGQVAFLTRMMVDIQLNWSEG
jgi:hypothetical protein